MNEAATTLTRADTVATMKLHERPYIFFSITDTWFNTNEVITQQIRDTSRPASYGMSFVALNHGRTPAILKQVHAKLYLCSGCPDSLDHRSGLDLSPRYEKVIAASQSSEKFRIYWDFETEQQYIEHHVGSVDFFACGLLVYEDVAGCFYEAYFCFKAVDRNGITEITEAGKKTDNRRT